MKRKDWLGLAITAANTASLFFVLHWLYRAMTSPGGVFMMFVLGIPMLVSGILLGIRYRKDIYQNPAALFSALGAGSTFVLLMAVPWDAFYNRLTAPPAPRSGTSILFGCLFVYYGMLAPVCPWLYRQSLAFFSQRGNH